MLILVLGSFLFVISETDTVNIGAILNFKTINGKVSTIAMKTAVDDVNSDPSILPGRRLSLSFHDANFSGFLSIVGGKVIFFNFKNQNIIILKLEIRNKIRTTKEKKSGWRL